MAAARSLIAVFREKHPSLLHRRDRGKTTSQLLKGQSGVDWIPIYGAQRVSVGVAGVRQPLGMGVPVQR